MSAQAYPTPTSPLYKLTCDYVRAANNKDYDAFPAMFAPEMSHQIHPGSLRTPGHEERVNAQQHIDRFKQMVGEGGLIENLNADIDHPVNVVEGNNCIVLQLNSHGKLTNGKDWPMEFIHIIRFNDDQKIVAVDSWNDSALAHSAFPGSSFPKFGEGGVITNMKEVTDGMKAQ